MTSESEPPVARAYSYRWGWRSISCGAVLFGSIGVGGAFLVPVGWRMIQAGQLPLGVAVMVTAFFAVPMVFLAVISIATGILDAFRPPMLRVTPGGIQLPERSRREMLQGEADEPDPRGLASLPVEIPFTAIRSAARERKPHPGSDRLVIRHDLTPGKLVIEQHMMVAAEFDDLEMVLRAAIPAAFEDTPSVR